MKTPLFFSSMGLCLLATGCEVFTLGTHNVLHEIAQYRDDRSMLQRYRKLADSAWSEIENRDCDTSYSSYHERGFKDGFVDYLDAGGTCDPPTFPPEWLQRARFESQEGVIAVEEWFAGYRHGATAARASGLRSFSLVPYSLTTPDSGSPVPVEITLPPAAELIPPPGEKAPGQDQGMGSRRPGLTKPTAAVMAK